MLDAGKRAFLAGAGALAATGAAAQNPANQTPASLAPGATVRVALQTALGVITLELATAAAPITSANFLHYVDAARLDGASFYRASKTGDAPLSGLIQGGLRNAVGQPFPPIAHESTTQTGLTHTDGVISMARYAPGSAASEFFICIGGQTYLDADPKAAGDNLGFAAFGKVVLGLDVARAILEAPTSPTAGEGVMKGQILEPPVAITAARRER